MQGVIHISIGFYRYHSVLHPHPPIASQPLALYSPEPCSSVIANLTHSQKKPDQRLNCVSYGLQFCVHATYGSACQPSTPIFHPQAGGSAMCLGVSCLDRDCLVVVHFGSQSHHDPRENSNVTPSFLAVVENIVWAISLGCASHQRNHCD
jgi:hypothetical protein